MDPSRRSVLRAGAGALSIGLAGCLGSGNSASGATVDSLPTPTLGPDDAPVTVAVYEDYSCPHCQHYVQDTFPQVRSNYIADGVVHYEHHDFPIPVNPDWSYQAASAARAVQDTVGTDAFFEFSTKLYDYLGNYSLDVVGRLASDVGADPEVVQTAATDLRYKPVLDADRSKGIDAGVQGTPTVFVNGTALSAYDWQTVSDAIESAR